MKTQTYIKIYIILLLWFISFNVLAQVPNTPNPNFPKPAKIVAGEYYFDTDPGFGNGKSIQLKKQGLSVSTYFYNGLGSLSEGYHVLSFRFKDENGKWSHTNHNSVYKFRPHVTHISNTTKIVAGEYYFDTDPGFGNGVSLSLSPQGVAVALNFDAPFSSLTTGYHVLSYRFKDENGKWSHANHKAVYKFGNADTPISNTTKIVAGEYYFDTDPGLGNGTSLSISPQGIIVALNIDIPLAGLTDGYHVLSYRFKDENGKWSHTNHKAVYKFGVGETPISNTTKIVAGEYYFDTDDPGLGNGTSLSISPQGVVVALNIDISFEGLTNGYHVLSCRFKDENGKWSHTNHTAVYKLNVEDVVIENKTKIVAGEYFFDTDPGFGKGVSIPVSSAKKIVKDVWVDMESLSIGNHLLYLRFKDEKGKWAHTNIYHIAKTEMMAPGNVTENIKLWIKPELGITNISNAKVKHWHDVISAHKLQADNETQQPIMRTDTNMINFNPVVEFDGTNDYLSMGDIFNGTNGELTTFLVSVEDVRQANTTFQFRNVSTNDRYLAQVPWSDGVIKFDAGLQRSETALLSNNKLSVGVPNISTFVNSTANSIQQIFVNSKLEAENNNGHQVTTDQATVGSNLGESAYNGRIAEWAVYDRYLSANELDRIHSYFALKYGISLDTNYFASDGTMIWNKSNNSNYTNNVFGIGRDDKQGLDQRISKSSSADNNLIIALQNDFTSANNNKQRTIKHNNDKQFLFISSDGGTAKLGKNEERPEAFNFRAGREWKVTKSSNFNQPVTLKFTNYTDSITYTLVKDNDGDFSQGAEVMDTLQWGVIKDVQLNDGDYFTIVTKKPDNALPIKLVTFNAIVIQGTRFNEHIVKLNWVTASEQNNDYFTIQRSSNAKDWNDIAIVNGAGNSSSALSYQLYDYRPLNGISYYRLKQTDYDGKFTFSDIKSVQISLKKDVVKLYPNPVKDKLTINRNNNTKDACELKLYSDDGQLLWSNTSSDNLITIDFSRFISGTYLLTINDNQEIKHYKIVKIE